jgi:hypothetical protein
LKSASCRAVYAGLTTACEHVQKKLLIREKRPCRAVCARLKTAF